MRYNVVEVLVEMQTEGDLLVAKEALLRGQGAPLWVHGANEGEQLANLCAALFVLDRMKQGVQFDVALRHYSAQVREIPF